ncbi:2-C-methyl-D-erythritol 4-phosphate cytidylyltransferase [Fluviicola sp.]|jgi:2-C-methyl-D-erythritol 4-phosphate cytidylyltransferase|uniref:2-C-methyl-D-erythritol 4-phosphate cytidylyltransferase n=1 Tax=Fluviicola sp. TaxID=1917219 RepID=UPI00281F62FD|nr:2-C-methyl-D-erythritol 4-phosphate cytidylyltransferase [Fluviicola sp.]MDR0802145.1 2-C-methyl-D-erythritol 4-phosphate cytidylyltransferase [Fluviicola sp.]
MLTFIITAGGIGKRMGGATPKQFLLLGGKPILMHTIEHIHHFDTLAELIITLPEDYLKDWERMCGKYTFEITHTVVIGGEERFNSIKNALKKASGEWIAVHDGVRPFVSKEVLTKLVREVKTQWAVIPVVPMKESIRLVEGTHSTAVSRSQYQIVQTPQIFEGKLLKKAYEQKYTHSFTDDASVVESVGVSIHLISGNDENIKITNPIDLKLAEILLQSLMTP